MKTTNIKFTFLFFFLLLVFTSCNKDDSVFQETKEENTIGNNDTNNPNNNNQQGENGEIVSYSINGNDLTKLKDYKVTGTDLDLQKDVKKHQEIWELVKKIVPLAYRKRISEFVLYNGEKSGGSAGYVFETSQDLSTWQMGIAIDYAYEGGFNNRGELAYTIIHEFGHIITLGKDQVNSSISENNCSNFFTGEGCSKTPSFINKLHDKFWKDIWSEFESAGENETKLDAFYQKHSSRFVTQYAATNPGEDSAEVFAVFVTRNGGANGNSMAEQKIELMYTYPEFVTLRNYIRGNISSKNSSAKNRFLPQPGTWEQANTFGNTKKLHCSH